jgi:transcriptional regulator with XRE-family HTH domain
MRAIELGEFLRSRRARVDPTEVGFPASGRRRAPGLRREELASIAGLTVSWLAKIEQGRAQSVSPEVLAALARALRLDGSEHDHLFSLAGLRSEPGETANPHVTPALRILLDELDPNPAYLLDGLWNILAWNAAEVALFPGLLGHTDVPPNLLELVFGDAELATLMVDHDEEQARLVAQFRLHRTSMPEDPQLTAFISRLEATSATFGRLWHAKDVAPFVTTRRVFDHPLAGRLEFDHHRLSVLDQGGAELVVYTSAEGSESALRLASATGAKRWNPPTTS